MWKTPQDYLSLVDLEVHLGRQGGKSQAYEEFCKT